MITLIIELPDEFEEHFDFDRFQDSFNRICGDIRTEGCLSGNYEYELANELKKAFDKAEKLKQRLVIGVDEATGTDKTVVINYKEAK